MSLRGEQDELTWYDICGPNVPNAELDREEEQRAAELLSAAKSAKHAGQEHEPIAPMMQITNNTVETSVPVIHGNVSHDGPVMDVLSARIPSRPVNLLETSDKI